MYTVALSCKETSVSSSDPHFESFLLLQLRVGFPSGAVSAALPLRRVAAGELQRVYREWLGGFYFAFDSWISFFCRELDAKWFSLMRL